VSAQTASKRNPARRSGTAANALCCFKYLVALFGHEPCFGRIYTYLCGWQSEFLAVRPQAFMRDRFEPLQNPGLLARVAANASGVSSYVLI
jgi:hypothetical protein